MLTNTIENHAWHLQIQCRHMAYQNSRKKAKRLKGIKVMRVSKTC